MAKNTSKHLKLSNHIKVPHDHMQNAIKKFHPIKRSSHMKF